MKDHTHLFMILFLLVYAFTLGAVVTWSWIQADHEQDERIDALETRVSE